MASERIVKGHMQGRRKLEYLERAYQRSGLMDAFREKFGRDPRPGDPIAFDPDAETPTPIDPKKLMKTLMEAGRETGIDPVILHAIETTGWILSEENVHLLSEEELQEWNEAIEEGRRIYGHESTRGR